MGSREPNPIIARAWLRWRTLWKYGDRRRTVIWSGWSPPGGGGGGVVGGTGGGEGQEDNKLPLYKHHPTQTQTSHPPKTSFPKLNIPTAKKNPQSFSAGPPRCIIPKALHGKLLHTGDLGRRRWGQSFSVEVR